MQPILIAALLTLVSTATLAGTLESELQKNGLTPRAAPTGGITYKRLSLGSYKVFASGDDLAINFVERVEFQDQVKLEVDGVKIEGANRGEFGGGLTITPLDGTTTTLLKENVVSIQQDNNAIFVFTGLSHMGMDNGAMYELKNVKTKPELSRVTLLASAPREIVFEKHIAYILTYDGLVAVNPSPDNASMEVIAYHAPWSRFAPNSLVKQGDDFIVGMHSGVTVVHGNRFEAKTVTFYGTEGSDVE